VMDTLVLHRACDTPIFVVRGGLRDGDVVRAEMFEPLDASWPKPKPGDRTVCPNCGKGFVLSDVDLLRTNVESW
jgi:hypothetical protein